MSLLLSDAMSMGDVSLNDEHLIHLQAERIYPHPTGRIKGILYWNWPISRIWTKIWHLQEKIYYVLGELKKTKSFHLSDFEWDIQYFPTNLCLSVVPSGFHRPLFFHCCVTICALKWLLTLKQHPLVPPPPCHGPKQHDAGTNHADTSGCVTTLRKGSDERWIYVIADRWHTLINKCYHERFKVRRGNWQHSNYTNLFIHVQFSQLSLNWKWIETIPFMGNFHTVV